MTTQTASAPMIYSVVVFFCVFFYQSISTALYLLYNLMHKCAVTIAIYVT